MIQWHDRREIVSKDNDVNEGGVRLQEELAVAY